MARLIALYSSAPGSGKSTAARLLERQGWVVEPFTTPLKRMARTLLLEAGYSEDAITDILSINKGQPLAWLAGAPTARHLLQTLGTAWGREQISPMLWIQLWQGRVRRALADGTPVVVDDLRTEEEAAVVRALDGLAFDRIITNSGTLEELEAQLLQEVAP